MKIAVVSDTHSFIEKTLLTIKDMGEIDLLIHLGDYVKDARFIGEELGIDVICVRGNGDYLETDIEEDRLIEINNKKIFLTHGHSYDVSDSLNKIFYKGKQLDADMVLFGHTHISLMVEHEGILILNPGSPNEPRSGTKGSIGLISVTDDKIEGEIILT